MHITVLILLLNPYFSLCTQRKNSSSMHLTCTISEVLASWFLFPDVTLRSYIPTLAQNSSSLLSSEAEFEFHISLMILFLQTTPFSSRDELCSMRP